MNSLFAQQLISRQESPFVNGEQSLKIDQLKTDIEGPYNWIMIRNTDPMSQYTESGSVIPGTLRVPSEDNDFNYINSLSPIKNLSSFNKKFYLSQTSGAKGEQEFSNIGDILEQYKHIFPEDLFLSLRGQYMIPRYNYGSPKYPPLTQQDEGMFGNNLLVDLNTQQLYIKAQIKALHLNASKVASIEPSSSGTGINPQKLAGVTRFVFSTYGELTRCSHVHQLWSNWFEEPYYGFEMWGPQALVFYRPYNFEGGYYPMMPTMTVLETINFCKDPNTFAWHDYNRLKILNSMYASVGSGDYEYIIPFVKLCGAIDSAYMCNSTDYKHTTDWKTAIDNSLKRTFTDFDEWARLNNIELRSEADAKIQTEILTVGDALKHMIWRMKSPLKTENSKKEIVTEEANLWAYNGILFGGIMSAPYSSEPLYQALNLFHSCFSEKTDGSNWWMEFTLPNDTTEDEFIDEVLSYIKKAIYGWYMLKEDGTVCRDYELPYPVVFYYVQAAGYNPEELISVWETDHPIMYADNSRRRHHALYEYINNSSEKKERYDYFMDVGVTMPYDLTLWDESFYHDEEDKEQFRLFKQTILEYCNSIIQKPGYFTCSETSNMVPQAILLKTQQEVEP